MLDSLTTSSTTSSIADQLFEGNEGIATTLSCTLTTALSSIPPVNIYICDSYINSLTDKQLASITELINDKSEEIPNIEKSKVLIKTKQS